MIKKKLKAIFKVRFKIADNKIIAPSFRGDIKTVNDISEEIARVVGYDNIQSSPLKIYGSKNDNKDSRLLEQNIKFFKRTWFFEVINNPFVKNKTADSIKVDNPLDSNRLSEN